jgi:hypothetical protein
MAREKWRFDRHTGTAELVDSFGPPIAPKALPRHNSTFAKRRIHVIRDLEPYISPIDRTVVSDRTAHRDHMRRHNVVEWGTEKPQRRQPPKLSSPRDAIRQAIEMHTQGYRPGMRNED